LAIPRPAMRRAYQSEEMTLQLADMAWTLFPGSSGRPANSMWK
jgi:hypothetical protein